MITTRQMPVSVEAEEFLIACCFIDGRDMVARCHEQGVTADSFFDRARNIIFGTIERVAERMEPDVAIVAEELKTSRELDAIGGYPELSRLSALVPTTAQATYFIEKVREQAMLRELIREATGAVEDCYNFSGGIEEFVDRTEARLFAVTQRRTQQGAAHVRAPARAALQVIGGMLERKGELTGVASGFKDLDALTWGFQKAEMIVLAARPSMGKTALALNFAEAAALGKKPVGTLVFSLEMSATQLALRMLCARARVNLKLLRDGLVAKNGEEMARLAAAGDALSAAPLYIDDCSTLTIMQLRAKARRVAARQKLGFIAVDYLQLLHPTDPRVPREQQVAEASRGLKALAKELDVPVLVLSQLNRASEKENRLPKLADLRESGAIEQDADVVLMLARPRDADEKYQVAADSAELVVAKQRNGPVGELKLTFLRDITRFENFHV